MPGDGEDRGDIVGTILWMIEKQRASEALVPCGNCGHDISDHNTDDSGACLFPHSIGAPFVLCRCGSFVG